MFARILCAIVWLVFADDGSRAAEPLAIVNASETQASVDAALTFGLLWLDHCREDVRRVVEGLQLFVPPRTSTIVRERI